MSKVIASALTNVIKKTKNVHFTPPQISNGINTFVFPCRKIVLNYCEIGGSSRGTIQFLLKEALNLAKEYPMVEIIVKPAPYKHPVAIAHYNNGKKLEFCLRNLPEIKVKKNIERLLGFAGFEKRLWKERVLSTTPSVRGIWSPFHTTPFSFRDCKKI
ncbi:hypothetical protein BB561_003629 [Smittium simulii]|uniref:Large ribosomal subunit protein mL43 n=1 Tax=Smittium simulii TaxID=133385 RepID=A0A2T9YK92_9FUNG|nr:hypothetical protein BB561_003629 [Smittium simulii]